MTAQDTLELPSMPWATPAYPVGETCVIHREILIANCAAPREAPQPVRAGLGDRTEPGILIPAPLNVEHLDLPAQRVLDDEPTIAGEREAVAGGAP